MSKHIALIVAAALALGTAGCATGPVVTVQTVDVAGVGPVEVEHLKVRVVSIDRPNRQVVIEQGSYSWLVDVPPLFGNLETVREGDMVEISRVDGVATQVRRGKRGAKPSIVYTEATDDAGFRNLPEKFVARAVTLTATFESFDPQTSVVNYVGPFGPRSLTVVRPEVKAALTKLKRGDMVELSFMEAFHIALN